jgi:acetoacetate decarboxylase
MRVSFRLDSPPGEAEAEKLRKELDSIMGPHSLQIRKFPSPERNGKPLKQLIHIVFEDVKIHEIWCGTAALEFGRSGAYPLIHRLEPREIVRAFWLKPEWILPYGKVIWEES